MLYLLRIFFITLILLLTNISTIQINAESIPDKILISTFEDDLTGNGQKEVVQLKGILFMNEGRYYQDLWVEVTSKHSEQWRIPFTGGYEPEVQFFDINNDNINELFYQNIIDDKDNIYAYYLYTLKNGVIEEIALPNQLYMKGQFTDNFQVHMQISTKNNNNPIIVDMKDRAREYEKIGLYDANGKLLQHKEVISSPYPIFEPVYISSSKGYGLKSFQNVYGISQNDKLGTVETLWYLENGNWVILQTDWIFS